MEINNFEISQKTLAIVQAKLNSLDKDKSSIPMSFNDIRIPSSLRDNNK